MEIAPDFFSYFRATSRLLDEDSTLYCISSWNDHGQATFVRNESQLHRSDFFPGLGWMLTKQLWNEIRFIFLSLENLPVSALILLVVLPVRLAELYIIWLSNEDPCHAKIWNLLCTVHLQKFGCYALSLGKAGDQLLNLTAHQIQYMQPNQM